MRSTESSSYLFVALILSVTIGCSSEQPTIETEVTELATWGAPQKVEVELFAPGVVNSTWPEFAITFTAKGDTAYFVRTIKNRSQLAIMRTIRKGGVWQNPDVAPFSGHFFDVDPFVAPGGGVFYSSRQIDPDQGGIESFDHWFWNGKSEPIRLPRPLSSDADETNLTGTEDGTLYFASNRSGEAKIYVSHIEGGVRQAPVEVQIPGTQSPGSPLISPDGNTLLFVNDLYGAAKIAFTCREESGWSVPLLFPRAINSAYVDFAPSIAPDGTFFFTSERPGMLSNIAAGERPPGDIYETNVNLSDLCQSN